jgi:hypothetical protein
MRNYLDILRENDDTVVEAVAKADITPQIASQAIMAAAQAQYKTQYTQPQATPAATPQQAPQQAPTAAPTAAPAAAPAAVSNTGAGAAAAGVGGGGTTSATDDPQQMAKQLADVLQPLSRDPKAKALLDAITTYTALPDRRLQREDAGDSKFDNMTEGMFTKSLKFSESFNPGKMLEKKVTKLTRIK